VEVPFRATAQVPCRACCPLARGLMAGAMGMGGAATHIAVSC
jgi:hypothetical protein